MTSTHKSPTRDGFTDAERIWNNTRVFHFHGQPIKDWPKWLFFTNFGYDGSRTIVIHRLDGPLIVNHGDTIKITVAGEMSVERT